MPTDFSKRADNALDQAVFLAQKINAKLIVYHVYHRPVAEHGQTYTLAEVERRIDVAFKKLLNVHSGLKEISYEFRKELGISLVNIAEVVNAGSIDLLVMATKGAKGLEVFWGTKTAKIIKMVEAPVLVIPDNTSLKKFEKISLACDYSLPTDSEEIIFFAELAEALKLNVDVITLNRDEKTMTKKQLENRELLIEQLQDVEASFSYTEHSSIEEGIIEYCQVNDIDAIAVLSKSYSFIERLFLESLTDRMVFRSPIPLLVL